VGNQPAIESTNRGRRTERLHENGIFTAGAASGDLNRETHVGDMIQVLSVDVRRGKALSLLVVHI
jgi:hypothetical protein